MLPSRLAQSLPVLGLLLAVSCGPLPRVQEGRLDLSGWNFEAGSVRLDGQWEFWWGRYLVTAGEPGTGEGRFIATPGYWNNANPEIYPAEGAATYRLRVRLPSRSEPWALALPDIACAWRLSVNGVFVAENGRASTDPAEYRALVRPRVVDLPAGSSELDLFLYVVNASDRVGGIRDSILIGSADGLRRQERLSQLDASFFTGGLVVMALFNLVIFFLQRQKGANLWLAVFSLFIAVRTMFTGPRIVQDLWPAITFELSAQVEFLCILGAVTSFILYLKFLFPEWWPARIFVSFLFYTALFAVLLFVLPVKTYASAFIGFYDLPLVFLSLLFLGVSWWATKKKHEDGPLVFFGMLFLLGGTLNDLIYQYMPLPQGYVLGRFLFVFLVFNTFLLSRQLSKDYLLTQQQTGELRKLDKMKDDFLARVTHELRTPIHGMAGILDAFRMGDFGSLSDRQKYHLSLLEASSKRLLSMVNSILDFSHLRRHQLVSEPRPILLKQTVDFLLPSFFSQLRPGVALVNRISDQVPAALGDEMRLEQVIHHLVKNSLQHTQAGTIALEAEVRDQQILLMVKDPGSGIPAEKLAQLFSPFNQVAEINTRSTGGLGLGLAVSRQLVQQMGGRLDLESSEGEGTTALIWLPVCPPSRLQYFQAQRLDRTYPLEERRFDEAAVSPDPPAAPESAPSKPAAGPAVLIVDDEPVNLLVLRTFLSRAGYTVIEATNGPDALKRVHEQPVDLMILDIMMPGMSGYEVCLKVRERFTPARLPVLLLTAKNQVEDLLQGFRCGASDFLTKPFQREELKARMDLHLKVSHAARAGTVVANRS